MNTYVTKTRGGGGAKKRKANEDLNLHWSKKDAAAYEQEGSAR